MLSLSLATEEGEVTIPPGVGAVRRAKVYWDLMHIDWMSGAGKASAHLVFFTTFSLSLVP